MNEQSRHKYDAVERLLLEIHAGEASQEDVDRLNELLLSDDDLRRPLSLERFDQTVVEAIEH